MKRQRDGGDDASQSYSPAKKVHSAEIAPENSGGNVSQADLSVKGSHGPPPEVKQGENVELGTTRDDRYYLEDGDLVLRVQNTLFKVPRYMVRDSRSITAMLESDRSGSPPLMGSSDDHPLVLLDETVWPFKYLLSLLTATPYSLVSLVEGLKLRRSFGRLVLLLEVATRHQFESTARLASALLMLYVPKYTDHLNETADADLLKHALTLLIPREGRMTQDELTKIFATRLLDRGIPPEAALEFADKHGLRSLQGAVYYTLLFPDTEENSDAKFAPQKFEILNGNLNGSDAQLQRRLLQGYWSLMRYSQLLAKTPPLDAEMCEALKLTKWSRLYTSKYKPALSHPLDMLEECKTGLIQFVDTYGSGLGVRRVVVVSVIDRHIEQFRDGLMDHFDPPE